MLTQRTTTTYTYRPDGLRKSKTTGTTTTTHVWDGSNISFDIQGSTTTKYVRGVNLVASVVGTTYTYPLYNGHGDVVQLANGSGTVTRSYSYDAFGVERETNVSPFIVTTNTYFASFPGYFPEEFPNHPEGYYQYDIEVPIDDLPPGQYELVFASYYSPSGIYVSMDVYLDDEHVYYGGLSNGGAITIPLNISGQSMARIELSVAAYGTQNYFGFPVFDGWVEETVVTPIPAPTGEDTNPWRYAGEYWDKETGSYYLRARYYTPGIGRFTQEDTHWNPGNAIYGDDPKDPLGLGIYVPDIYAIRQSGNLYGYCVNNPVSYVDPTGYWVMGISGSFSQTVYIAGTQCSVGLVVDGHGNYGLLLSAGAGAGVPAISGYGSFIFTWDDSITDLTGIGGSIGGGYNLGLVIGGDFVLETDGKNGLMINIGGGASVFAVDAHAFVTGTYIILLGNLNETNKGSSSSRGKF